MSRSDRSINRSEKQSLMLDLSKLVPDTKKEKKTLSIQKMFTSFKTSVQPIDFNSIERLEIQNEILSYPFDTGNFRDRYISEHLSANLRTAIYRFYIALDAYIDSPTHKQTADEIIRGMITNKDYATFLKRMKLKSFIISTDLEMLETPDWWENQPYHLIDDIGDIFNYQYIIPWDEDTDDYKWGETDLIQDESTLLKFKHKARELLAQLPDDIEEVHAEEILFGISSSSSLISMKSLPRYEAKEVSNEFSSKPIEGVRTKVYVSPGNVRDTVILDPSTVNTIQWIDRQTHRLLQNFEENGMIDDPDFLFKKLKNLDKYSYKLCRDIVKEGITKPRNLLVIILEELHFKYPQLGAYSPSLMTIYSDYILHINEECKHLKRGHGLGMANSLTTLMQIIIFHMMLDEILDTDTEETDISAIFYNDDATIFANQEGLLDMYNDIEEELFEKLGLLRQPKKSFWGPNAWVFCEIYFPEEYNFKESYARRECLLPLACTTICQAKDMIHSLSKSANADFVSCYIYEIIAHWGYEFHSKEVNMPYIFGGWLSDTYKNVSYDLQKIEGDYPFNEIYEATKLHIHHYRKPKYHLIKENGTRVWKKLQKEDYKSPIERFMKPTEHFPIPERFKKYLQILTRNEVEQTLFRGTIEIDCNTQDWVTHQYKRLKTFHSSKVMGGLELINKIISENPEIDYVFESKNSIAFNGYDNFYQENPVMVSKTPLLSLINYYIDPKKRIDGIFPNPIPIFSKRSKDTPYFIIRNWERGLLTARKKVDFTFDIASKLFIPADQMIEERYFNIQNVMESLYQRCEYRIPIPPLTTEKQELINLRDSILKIRQRDLLIYPKMSIELWNLVISKKITPEELMNSIQELLLEEPIKRENLEIDSIDESDSSEDTSEEEEGEQLPPQGTYTFWEIKGSEKEFWPCWSAFFSFITMLQTIKLSDMSSLNKKVNIPDYVRIFYLYFRLETETDEFGSLVPKYLVRVGKDPPDEVELGGDLFGEDE